VTIKAGEGIDIILGPSEGRFFSNGFRKVEHEFTPTHVAFENGLPRVTFAVRMTYPSDWSIKPGKELNPHLSTVDAFVISVQLAELLLICHHVDLKRTWIAQAIFTVGSEPQPVDRPIESQAYLVAPPSETPAGVGWTVSCAVGSIRVQMRLVSATLPAKTVRTGDFVVDDELGDGETRFYAHGYRTRTHHIDNITFGDDTSMTARVSVTGGGSSMIGLESGFGPTVSMLDCILAQAQMSQVLLFSLDGLTRDQANTMWMRRIDLEASTPFRPNLGPFWAQVHIAATQILNLHGHPWMTATFEGSFAGISSSYKVACQLPEN